MLHLFMTEELVVSGEPPCVPRPAMNGSPASCRLRLAAILTALGSSSQHGSLSASSARWSPTPPEDQPAAGLVEPSPEQVEGGNRTSRSLGPRWVRNNRVSDGHQGQQLSPTDRRIRSSAFL
jgi:hypothetical protein